MNNKALGIIETMGLIPAVEAGDVALKTAEVSVIGSQAVGGGLVSILISGDVAAVNASTEAGSTAAARLGTVCSVTVIPRRADGLDEILIEETKRPTWFGRRKVNDEDQLECSAEKVTEVESMTTSAPVDQSKVSVQEVSDVDKQSSEPSGIEDLNFNMTELRKMKIANLRRLVKQLPTGLIPNDEVKLATKKDLLEAFRHYSKTIEK